MLRREGRKVAGTTPTISRSTNGGTCGKHNNLVKLDSERMKSPLVVGTLKWPILRASMIGLKRREAQ
jgi:hypothetical protein